MKKVKEEIAIHQKFGKRYEELLSHYPKRNNLKLYYLKILFVLMKEFSFRDIFCEVKLRVSRHFRYHNNKQNIGILVDYLDKGGMEQGIANIVSKISEYNPCVFITGNQLGEKGWLLTKKGFRVYVLKDNFELFKEIASRDEIKIINSHFSVWNIWGISELLKIKVVYTIHSAYTWIEDSEIIKNRIEAYKYVDHFVAVSSSVKNYFANKFNINSNKISVIENGINYEEFHRVPVDRRNNKDFTFLNVGSFTPLKNQMLLITAFEKIYLKNKNVKLCLIGNNLDPKYANHIKEYIRKRKLSKKIHILPFVDKRKLSTIYESSNCFVLSSLQEGAPNVLLESLYFDLPTISTNVGNASEVLGKNGILIPNSYDRLDKVSLEYLVNLSYSEKQKNKKELVIAMQDMIERYDDWLHKSEDMHQYILSEYSVSKMVDGYEEIFRKCFK